MRRIESSRLGRVLQLIVVNPTTATITTWNLNPNSIFPGNLCSDVNNLSPSREELGLFRIGWIVENNTDFWSMPHCGSMERLEMISLPRNEVDWWWRKIGLVDVLSHVVLLPF